MENASTPGEAPYWFALSELSIPYNIVMKHYREFGSVAGLWSASEKYLRDLGLDKDKIAQFLERRTIMPLSYFSNLLLRIQSRGITITTIVSPDYPPLLKIIRGGPPNMPPLVLFHQGALKDYSSCVAIVGTRQSSNYGTSTAREVARQLAQVGYTIVSGLARGIDTQAHSGALDVNGRTIAVLAWMDPIYPPENRVLHNDILKKGAVISEHYNSPKGSAGQHLFVERNRITSGISNAVIIVESTNTGGTMWQFNLAKEQGTPIFALVPKDPSSVFVKGYEYFVRNGATPFRLPTEILDKLTSQEGRIDSYIG